MTFWLALTLVVLLCLMVGYVAVAVALAILDVEKRLR